MTRDEAVTTIQRRLSFRQGQEDNIEKELRNAQFFYEQGPIYPWFLRTTDELAFVSGQDEVGVPDGFLEQVEATPMEIYNEEGDVWFPLRRVMSLDEKMRAEGTPKMYTRNVGGFRFNSTADEDYRLRLHYYKADVVLNENVENLWLRYAPELLVGRAGNIVAGALRDVENEAKF